MIQFEIMDQAKKPIEELITIFKLILYLFLSYV